MLTHKATCGKDAVCIYFADALCPEKHPLERMFLETEVEDEELLSSSTTKILLVNNYYVLGS